MSCDSVNECKYVNKQIDKLLMSCDSVNECEQVNKQAVNEL